MKKLKYNCWLAALLLAGAGNLNAQTTEDSAVVLQKPAWSSDKTHIAFDVQPTRHVTGAISTVKGTALEQNYNLNLGNTLYGRLAGLTVTQGGSEPGQAVPGIFVRGVNTLGGAANGPLFVIDGYISSGLGSANAFQQLIPEEIESVSVLKDAAATAVWGARAANGVVLITTKRGGEGPLKVSFSTRQGFTQPQYLPKFLNAQQYATLFNEALVNDGLAPRYTAADIEAYGNGSDPLFRPNVNWYDEVLRKRAMASAYNLSFSGGDKFVRYFATLNALMTDNLYKRFGDENDESANGKYSKYNFRTNLDFTLSKRFSAEFKIGGAIEETLNPGNYTTGGTFNLLQSLPANAFPVRNPNGTFGGSNVYANPVADLLSTGFSRNNSRTILSALKFNLDLGMLIEGLSASAAVSLNNYFEQGSRKVRQYARFALSRGTVGDTLYGPAIGQNTNLTGVEQTLDQYSNIIYQGFLNYKRTFGKADVSGMLMFSNDVVNYFGPATDPSTPTANSTDPYRHNSASGRFTYVYDGKYIAEFSAGYMGSDFFAPGNRYGFFPSGSVGWILSNENFLKANKSVNFLKLRASYGLVGNDIIAPLGLSTRYAYTPTFGANGYFFGLNTTFAGLGENGIANPNVTWEKEKSLNVGVDFTLFKNFDISADWFKRDRYDIFVTSNSTIPSFLGINTPSLNQGKTKSTGVDFSVRYNSNVAKALKFFTEVQGGYFDNEVVFNAEPIQLNPGLVTTGYRIGQPFGLRAIGFYSEADVAARAQNPLSVPGVLTETIRPGDIKFQDIGGPNGVPDGIIDANDRVAIGNPGLPNFTLGLHSGFRWKRFDLDFVLQGVTGNTVNLGGNVFAAFQNNGTASEIALGRWTSQTASTATYPRLSSRDNLNNYQFSSFFQRDGSFIKLRSAELGYTVPLTQISTVKVEGLRFYFTGTNLFSLDRIEYGDPESLSGYPVLRTLTVGARIQL